MASTPGSLTTALTGNNNDLVWTARFVGRASARLKVAYVDPGAASQSESVSVSHNETTGVTTITVSLATDGSSAITSTGDTIKATVAADPDANALVSVADAAANDGSGVVTALAATALSAGAVDGTTKGYASIDEMEDDGWKAISTDPDTAVILFDGEALTVAADTANGLLEAAYWTKEQILAKKVSPLRFAGVAAD